MIFEMLNDSHLFKYVLNINYVYRKWICRNDSGKRIFWDVTIIVLALWNVFYIPFYIVFDSLRVSLSILTKLFRRRRAFP